MTQQSDPALAPSALSRHPVNPAVAQPQPNQPQPGSAHSPTNPLLPNTATTSQPIPEPGGPNSVSTTDVSTRLRSNDLFFEAVRQSNLPPRKKLAARLAYRVPGIREDVDDFIEAKASEAGDVNAMTNGDIIRIIIENLPAIIELLLKLFGGL